MLFYSLIIKILVQINVGLDQTAPFIRWDRQNAVKTFFCGGKNQTGIGSIGHGLDTLELFKQVSGITFLTLLIFSSRGLNKDVPSRGSAPWSAP